MQDGFIEKAGKTDKLLVGSRPRPETCGGRTDVHAVDMGLGRPHATDSTVPVTVTLTRRREKNTCMVP